jgi:hypothetical protein
MMDAVMKRARARFTALASLAILALATPGHAEDARLRARLDPATAASVEALADEARADGLPVEPLIGQALQGASKNAPPERIVTAVRQHLTALREARTGLGAGADEAELVAGAGAVLAGVPRDSLARMRASRPGQSLVVPLVVLADLVARRVPPAAASAAVMNAARAGARDQDFLRLRERIEQDIQAGVAPAAAAELRARALLLKSAPGPTRPTPRRGEP